MVGGGRGKGTRRRMEGGEDGDQTVNKYDLHTCKNYHLTYNHTECTSQLAQAPHTL